MTVPTGSPPPRMASREEVPVEMQYWLWKKGATPVYFLYNYAAVLIFLVKLLAVKLAAVPL